MLIQPMSQFCARQSGTRIRVLKVVPSITGDNRFDICKIVDLKGSRGIRKTTRYVQADSIRRRYFGEQTKQVVQVAAPAPAPLSHQTPLFYSGRF